VVACASVVVLSAAPFLAAGAAKTRAHDATAKICNVATNCPTIVATAKSTVTERDITRFLAELWSANFEGGPLGTYQLQRCSNPGAAPYHVDCVLFSTGTVRDLQALRQVFLSSRLFVSVGAQI
jgi:hypothetical protein